MLPFLTQQCGFHKTGSQPVKTGSQPVKQEVNKVLKTGFLFYSLTSCVIDLLVLSAVVFPPDFKSQLMLLCNFFWYCQSHQDNLHLPTVTAYWRLIILSWANSRLGVPDLLDCQSWLSLPDILLFVLLCFWKKRVSRFWLVWVTFLWKSPKGAALWSGVYPLLF